MEVEKEAESNSNKNGRLCFKLKMKSEPTTTATDHDQDMKIKAEIDEENQELLLPFVCPVCRNRFKSGKALGGHKRMHNLPPKKLKSKNKKTNNNNYYNNTNKRKRFDCHQDEEEDIEPICPLCDKSFRSMKSLFGHMRSHPDRGWRGIQPPPPVVATSNTSSSSISTQDDDDDDSSPVASPKGRLSSSSPKTPPPPLTSHDLELERSLKKGNWSVTARRGSGKSSSCSCSSSSAASSYVGMEDSTREAVLGLMLFAHHKPNARAELPKRANDDHRKEEEDDEYDDPRTRKNKVMKKRMKKTKLVRDLKQEDVEEDEQEQGQVTMLTCNGGTGNSASISIRAKSGGGEYMCSDCKRSFPSYQALGGHRSSHNKQNIKANFDDGSLAQPANETATSTDDDHKDDSGGGDGVSAEKKIFLDFDLNELPPTED